MYKKDVDVLSAVKDLVFNDDTKFNYSDGLNIAVAFTQFNNNEEWELTPDYGELVVNSYSWGTDPDGSFFTRRTRLQSHTCTLQELNLADEKDQ